jgi:hypothetical protein
MKGRIIDFYAGLGGASEAFVKDGRFQVVRIDNNVLLREHVEYIFINDILSMPAGDIEFLYGKADLMIFAPPCTEFSLGFHGPRSRAARDGTIEDYKPDMSHLLKCLEIIKVCQPKYYIIENVVGATKYFEPHLGEPTQIIGPFCLWHNLPLLSLTTQSIKDIKIHKSKSDVWSTNPLRSNHKAKWPYELSNALKKSFFTPTLEEWL